MTLRFIMNALERRAGKTEGSTSGSSIPGLDMILDFFVGTTSDLNMSRMVDFYESNSKLEAEHHANAWNFHPSVRFEEWVNQTTIDEETYKHPTFAAYRLAHTD